MVDLSGLLEEDEFTELMDANIPRIDLVDKSANGMRFLIAKRADGPAGLIDADTVRDLIAKADPEPEPTSTDGDVTMTGSPAAIAKFIHQAAQRAAAPPQPDNPNADGSLKGAVTKEMDMADDLDPTVVLAEPDADAPGMDTDPGSPAWEAIDAATARKWTSILARARNAVDMLADREMLEAAAGDDDDAFHAMDLQDACCAIDYAISVLAPFAVAEQAEADCCDEMAAVGKALGGWDPAALDTIEALGQVRKAGRVLSSANESAIRGAVESLQKVLASLPQAPSVPDDGQSVAKEQETDMTSPTQTAEPAAVAKADGEKPAIMVVYDQRGRLVGVVDPDKVTPVANSEADPEPSTDDAPPADAAADAAPADAPAATDMTPAPAGEVGTPADAVDGDVTKKTATLDPDNDNDSANSKDGTETEDVLKSIATGVVDARIADYSATHEQAITKTAADIAAVAKALEAVAEVSKAQEDRLKALEEQEAVSKVFANGAVPPAHQMRGQDRGTLAAQVDVAKAAELRKTLYGGSAQEQNQAALDMQAAAIEALAAIHRR